MLGVMPCSARAWRSSSLAYGLPRSVWCTSPAGTARRARTAQIVSAEVRATCSPVSADELRAAPASSRRASPRARSGAMTPTGRSTSSRPTPRNEQLSDRGVARYFAPRPHRLPWGPTVESTPSGARRAEDALRSSKPTRLDRASRRARSSARRTCAHARSDRARAPNHGRAHDARSQAVAAKSGSRWGSSRFAQGQRKAEMPGSGAS